MDDKEKAIDVNAKISYSRRYDLGRYQSEEWKVELEAPSSVLLGKSGETLAQLSQVMINISSMVNGVFVSQRQLDPQQFAPLTPAAHKPGE